MTDDRAEREYVRKLFSPNPHEVEPEPERTRSNVVPREGNNPGTQPTGDEATRQWVNDLFDYSGVPGC
ncbi:hypothetical protein AB0I37_14290 [Micromonospora purpureochromogenes]|uniref:hypothetical protein n=1 Tax=Micromonospora purpureochromogenes TaxID=47872 RepID=UPI0033FEA8E4